MTAYVALLRAINLGPHQKIAMTDLRAFAENIGLSSPRTILQTGNLLFESAGSAAKLEAALEKEAAASLGLETPMILRSAAQWAKLIADNPFQQEAKAAPNRLVVMPLKAAATAAKVAALCAAHKGPEAIAVRGATLYIVYRDGIGGSKLTNKKIESALGVLGTGRNWNTALKIAAMLSV